jgi:TonB family protein
MLKSVQCEEFEGLAVLYAVGEMEPPVRAAIEEHARLCANCAAILRREVQLAQALAAAGPPTADPDPSDLLLARCRSDLSRTLDKVAAEQPRGWRNWLRPGAWTSRLSFDFHPAWSVATLALVAVLSAWAGWKGVGPAALRQYGPAIMTVSAAAPPPIAPPPAATHQDSQPGEAAAPAPPAAQEQPRVYADQQAVRQTGFGMAPQFADDDLSLPSLPFDSGNLPHPQGLSGILRHEPPPRLSHRTRSDAAWNAYSSSRLDELSRRMEALLDGGLRVDPADQQRRLVQSPPPEYPEVARRAGIEGEVTLGLRIGPDGSVQDVTLLSGEPVLGRAAAEAVEQWRYAPLRIDGDPVNILTSVTFDFELR